MVAGLALTGCAEEEPPKFSSGGSSASSDGSTAQAEAPEPSQPPEETEEPEEPVALPAATPSECLVGTWIADNEKLAAQMAALAEGSGTVNSVSGVVTLTLTTDGITSTSYSDWTVDMTAEGQQVTIVRNGVDAGTYTVEADTHLTLTETAPNSEVAMFLNGAASGTVPGTDTMPVTGADFSCDNTVLTIISPLTNLELVRQ